MHEYRVTGGKNIAFIKGNLWSESKTNNKVLNSIFAPIDDGNGIIDEDEAALIAKLLMAIDVDQNDEISEQELLDAQCYDVKAAKVAVNIAKGVYAQSSLGAGYSGNSFDKAIKEVNKDNVVSVIESFPTFNEGKSLTECITKNMFMDDKQKEKALKHVFNQLMQTLEENGCETKDLREELKKELEYIKKYPISSSLTYNRFDDIISKSFKRLYATEYKSNYLPNGKLDQDFAQGNEGDCWLLGTIKSIQNSKDGRQILDECLRVDMDGNVHVTLKGANKTYVISQEEILANTQYSSGDLDVRAIEIAFDKYFAEQRGVGEFKSGEAYGVDNFKMQTNLDGGMGSVALELLTGTPGYLEERYLEMEANTNTIFGYDKEDFVEAINSKKYNLMVSSHISEDGSLEFPTKNADNTGGVIYEEHLYYIIKADNDTITLSDSHDTSNAKIKTMTWNEFKKIYTHLEYDKGFGFDGPAKSWTKNN